MPLETGQVQAIGQTDKGTPKLQIGGKWYYAGRGVDVSEVKQGSDITLEYTLFGDNKNVRGIKNWSFNPQKTPAEVERSNGELSKPVNTLTQNENIFICGVINHAIDAKLITASTDISTWVKAAVEALRHFDDTIPY